MHHGNTRNCSQCNPLVIKSGMNNYEKTKFAVPCEPNYVDVAYMKRCIPWETSGSPCEIIAIVEGKVLVGASLQFVVVTN